MRERMFDHDGLDVYGAARQFKRQLRGLIREIPRGNSDLLDQLKRSARAAPRRTGKPEPRGRDAGEDHQVSRAAPRLGHAPDLKIHPDAHVHACPCSCVHKHGHGR